MNQLSNRALTPLASTLALLAFAVAVWLRVVTLGRDGFWLDEIYSVSFANLSAVGNSMHGAGSATAISGCC